MSYKDRFERCISDARSPSRLKDSDERTEVSLKTQELDAFWWKFTLHRIPCEIKCGWLVGTVTTVEAFAALDVF